MKLSIAASYGASKIKKQSPSTAHIPIDSGLCDNLKARRRHLPSSKMLGFLSD
ncbi:MAG: hypothetical protein KJ600_04090 [Nanoarchaeota archaeon]|nr:hypothetical protein [Nanoarchaeota archaeon]MBU1103708.1 hypothetical protein [Nanoarchaeota archaeon]